MKYALKPRLGNFGSFLKRLGAFVVAGAIIAPSAFAFPAATNPSGFKSYLNSRKTSWDSGDKITFKRVSGCNKIFRNGNLKAYECSAGVLTKKSPSGVISVCNIDRVKLKRNGKIKLTTFNCVLK